MRIAQRLGRLSGMYRSWASNRAIHLSTAQIDKKLLHEPIGILVDSNVHHHTVTHETGWIPTGEKRFGPHIRGTGYAARVPVFKKNSTSKTYGNVCYLAAIAQLAKIGGAKLWTSHHLILERSSHPRSRFADVGWFDFNLFGRGELPSIDGDPYEKILMAPFNANQRNMPTINDELKKSNDALYLELLKVLGEKNSQDAWHIRTAEVNGLYCFLTMEKKLINIIHAQRNRPVIKGLKTRILDPKALGSLIGLKPIDLKHFDHVASSWFVRPDLHWEGEKRPKRPINE